MLADFHNSIVNSIFAAKNKLLILIYSVPGKVNFKNPKDYELFPGLSVPGESLSVPQACLRLFSTL